MNSSQNKPTLLTLKEELAATSNYDGSFVRGREIVKEIEDISGYRIITYFS